MTKALLGSSEWLLACYNVFLVTKVLLGSSEWLLACYLLVVSFGSLRCCWGARECKCLVYFLL